MNIELIVSLCSVLAFVGTTLTVVWKFAVMSAHIEAKITQLENQTIRLENRTDKYSAYPARLSVLESQVGSIRSMRSVRMPSVPEDTEK